MASERCILSALLAAALLAVPATTGAAFAAAPGEPLIFTESPDPDPNFVPPREPRRQAHATNARKPAKPTMNQVMEDLGRLTGQLELLGERVRQARRNQQTSACAGGPQAAATDHSGPEQPCNQ
jgi:hypothetical protein